MQDKYLFRGNRTDGQGWVEGSLIQKHSPHHVENMFWRSHIHDGAFTAFEVDPKTVGQWTGGYDKNRVRIFKGDVVKLHGEAIFVVDWNDNYCRFEFRNLAGVFTTIPICSYRSDFHEIIGSIHDNPELLTTQQG